MSAGFAVIYKWTIRPGHEERFISAWATATEAFRTVGALGSRLHRADSGELVAYAEWPSRAAWEAAGAQSPVDEATGAVMRAATLHFEMLPVTPIADLLQR